MQTARQVPDNMRIARTSCRPIFPVLVVHFFSSPNIISIKLEEINQREARK